MTLRSIPWLIICSLTVTASAAEFNDRIQPLFKHRCVRCHGPNQPKGELNLSTAAGVGRGGQSGPAIVAGQLDQGMLWPKIEADEMPPDDPLSDAEKSLLREWIAGGAVGLSVSPIADPTHESTDHWAFQPLRNPTRPGGSSPNHARTSIDDFIQAKLASRGLKISGEADAATLVRRVCLDVTGLPPTPTEVSRFLADTSPDAYERMVDQYLASPRFGERWGKHWLDAAGYADSNGYFSADTDRPLAYRYRDYVIRSLNADKPFDQFVREQLAGDELAAFRPGEPTTPEAIELLEATHFLRNGQDGTDIGIQEPDAFEIDRRAALEACVQVTASSLLGLTLHCARCHDHKFEPITQREYYQFQAILFPAFNPQDWVNPQDRIVYAYLPGEKEPWLAQRESIRRELAELRREYLDWMAAHREPAEMLLEESFADDTWRTRWSGTAPGDDRPGGEITMGPAAGHAAQVVESALRILAGGDKEAWLSTTASFDWTPDKSGDWVQATFDLIDHGVGGQPAERIAYMLAAHDFDDSSPVPAGNLLIDGHPSSATQVYRDYPGADQSVVGQIGEHGYKPGRNYGVRVTNVGDRKYRLEHLVDDLPDGKSLELTENDLPDGGFAFVFYPQRSFVVDSVRIARSRDATADQPAIQALREQRQAKRKEYERRRGELEAQQSPQPGRAIAWVTDKSADPPEVPFLTRGLYYLRGPNVEPAAPQVLTDAGREFQPRRAGTGSATTGRRLGLAEWLTHPQSRPAALLARVQANRIWRQYFGRGIVPTTDNLGQSGAPTTHPELLDHLAAELIRNGWSQKRLHRYILMSSVYRQSSAPRLDGLAADPDNRLWWRFPLRRLEAEVIRDAMLAVSGQLDLASSGPYVPTKQTPVGEVIVDFQTPGARRRAVYLQQRRSQIVSLLKVFDAPTISTVCTSRSASTVPLQSLALLNSEFAILCGEAFARQRMIDAHGSPAHLVRCIWHRAVGRPPTPAEEAIAVDFLATQGGYYTGDDANRRAVADLCQMVLASNAFLYLE